MIVRPQGRSTAESQDTPVARAVEKVAVIKTMVVTRSGVEGGSPKIVKRSYCSNLDPKRGKKEKGSQQGWFWNEARTVHMRAFG